MLLDVNYQPVHLPFARMWGQIRIRGPSVHLLDKRGFNSQELVKVAILSQKNLFQSLKGRATPLSFLSAPPPICWIDRSTQQEVGR